MCLRTAKKQKNDNDSDNYKLLILVVTILIVLIMITSGMYYMPRSKPNGLHTLSHLNSQKSYEMGKVLILILQEEL